MDPRSVEEDASSEINHNPHVDLVYYKVTIAAIAHNPFRVENVYMAYSFVAPGMSDIRRMRRALCYFDKALFRDGVHRHRLVNNTYDDTRTAQLFRAMSEAYVSFSETVYKCDDTATIFTASLDRTTDTPVIVATNPLVYTLYSRPAPLLFDNLSICSKCLRVEEGKSTNPDQHTCVKCIR